MNLYIYIYINRKYTSIDWLKYTLICMCMFTYVLLLFTLYTIHYIVYIVYTIVTTLTQFEAIYKPVG